MDLLGTYDSSSDEEETSSNNNNKEEVGPVAKGVAVQQAATTTRNTSAGSSRRRGGGKVGKRIVSLHAVLPQAIRDELSKNNPAGYDDSSSDNDEDEIEITSAAAAVGGSHKKKEPTKSPNTNSVKKDSGISSLLSELQSTTPAIRPTMPFASTAAHDVDALTDDQKPSTTAMGLSLISTTTTTTTTTTTAKKGQDAVDIHATTEDSVSSESNEQTNAAVGAARPTSTRTNPAPSATLPKTTSTTTTPIAAIAPRRFNAAPTATQQPQVATTAAASSMGHSLNEAPSAMHQYPPEFDNTAQTQQHSKKKSKRQLEQALRSGQFDTVVDDNTNSNIVSIQAQDRSGYVAPQQHEQYQSHGIQKAAVKMYNSSMGSDELQNQVTSKHRSKHQINQLVQSAVNLELQRSQQAGLVSNKQSNRRANPKRKYGW